jgi:hypothetical protein
MTRPQLPMMFQNFLDGTSTSTYVTYPQIYMLHKRSNSELGAVKILNNNVAVNGTAELENLWFRDAHAANCM